MRIGRYDVHLLDLGRFRMDGGGLFGIIPLSLWSRAWQPRPAADSAGRIPLAARSLLLRGDGRTIVVDAGPGDKLDRRRRSHFALEDAAPGALRRALAAHGVAPGDVTDFLFTHLHFDHAGGATQWAAGREGEAEPLFPRARHWIQKAQLDWARSPSDKDRASYLPENWEPIAAAGMLKVIDGPCEWLPGLELRISNGHTRGLQMLVIHETRGDAEIAAERAGAGGTGGSPGGAEGAAPRALAYITDLVPTAAHLPLAWIPAFDNEPLVALEEKRSLLEEVVEKGWSIALGHDPIVEGVILGRAPGGKPGVLVARELSLP